MENFVLKSVLGRVRDYVQKIDEEFDAGKGQPISKINSKITLGNVLVEKTNMIMEKTESSAATESPRVNISKKINFVPDNSVHFLRKLPRIR